MEYFLLLIATFEPTLCKSIRTPQSKSRLSLIEAPGRQSPTLLALHPDVHTASETLSQSQCLKSLTFIPMFMLPQKLCVRVSASNQ